MINGFVGDYWDPGFYSRDDIAARLELLGIPKGGVRQVVVDDEEVGLFSSADLRKLTLLDFNNNHLGKLLAKINTSEQKKKEFYIARKIKNPDEDIIYRLENQKFQESLGLLTPLVIYYETKRELTKRKKEEPVYISLFSYWEGPSADMDVIALRDSVNSRREKVDSDAFILAKDKEKYSSEIKTLEDAIRDEIVLKALDTMIDFSTKATDIVENNGFKLPNTNVKIEVVENPFNFYIGNRERQFKAMLYWNLVNAKERTREDVLREGKDIKSMASEKWDVFNKLVEPLRDYIFVGGRNVYSQGDQHLHNFKRAKLRNSDEVRMGVFDMGSLRIEDPIFGASRLLASYLLGFNREQIRDVYSRSYSDFVAKFKPKADKIKLELAFELCTLIETLWSSSRRAHDNIYNKGVYEAKTGLLGEKYRIYCTTLLPLADPIELPRSVDYRLFNPPTAIAVNKRCMRNIIQGLRSDITSYYGEPNLEEHIKKLEEFLEKSIIETKIG